MAPNGSSGSSGGGGDGGGSGSRQRSDANRQLLSPSSAAIPPSSSSSSLYSNSAAGSSRPVSMLSPARAAVPSSSQATVSFVGSNSRSSHLGGGDRLSASPSSTATSNNVGAGGAMSRLKRVASNASIASLIAHRKQASPAAGVAGGGGGGGGVDSGEASAAAGEGSGGGGGDDAIASGSSSRRASTSKPVSVLEAASPKLQNEAEKSNGAEKFLSPDSGGQRDQREVDGDGEDALTVKRRRPREGQANAVNKAARRRTWFGYAPMETESTDDSAVATEEMPRSDDQTQRKAGTETKVEQALPNDKGVLSPEESQSETPSLAHMPEQDSQDTVKANSGASGKPSTATRGWIPWRGPTNTLSDAKQGTTDQAQAPQAEQPLAGQSSSTPQEAPALIAAPSNPAEPTYAGYSGTIRRLWSGAESVATSTGLGWPASWGRDSGATHPTEEPMDTAPDGASEPVLKQPPEDDATQGTPPFKEANGDVEMTDAPARDSFVYRWLPSWGARPSPTTQEEASAEANGRAKEPSSVAAKTPAEQIKEEALSRMSAESSSKSNAGVGARDAVLNPATRSMWVNYFASRAARPAPRVEPVDEGPEVMKIDIPGRGEAQPASKETSSKENQLKPDARRGAEAKTGDTSSTASTAKPLKMAKTSKGLTIVAKDEVRSGTPDSVTNHLLVNKPDPAAPTSRPSTPLTGDRELARKVTKAAAQKRDPNASPASATQQHTKPKQPPPPNLILPSFEDVFTRPPRSFPPPMGIMERTLSAVNSYLFSAPPDTSRMRNKPANARLRKASLLSLGGRSAMESNQSGGRGGEDAHEYAMAEEAEQRLPRLWSVMGDKDRASSRGCRGVRKVAIVGVHGWFSKGPLRNVFGEPTGTSTKFATMMSAAVHKHFRDSGAVLKEEDVEVIALEGDGKVSERVDKLFAALLGNQKHVKAIAEADALFVAAHSQGSVVATHLLARLIEQGHVNVRTTRTALLAMCGIHHGPFPHLSTNAISSYYLNMFETPAAKELFEFQTSSTSVSQQYQAALKIIISAGVKLIYVASLDDQVVPLYSALHSSVSHPSILRALYCDGQAFPRVDFLTNLLSFCVAVRNAGLTDHGLLTLLSASVAGSLYGGLGHSLVYEEANTYTLAVRYLFEVTSPRSEPSTKPSEGGPPPIRAESFEAQRWNPYALPWSLRGLLEDPQVRDIFGQDIEKLLHDYTEWQPSTKTLKDVQFRLEPMRLVQQRRGNSTRDQAKASGTSTPSSSKL